MNKIIQLSETVANQISAGEVIERPASVVKELVENSIDASSSKIIIEIDNGGKDKIRVKDNGTGIAQDDLELAFSRYATSKIKNINDLYSLRTLGFRGEALASIASVSEIAINTRTASDLQGTRMQIKGGRITNKEPTGLPVGTDIIVKDLFYNTPARYKYLKTNTTEFGHISDIINKEALAYPEIKFSLFHNNKTIINTPGTGDLKDTIYALYGQELVQALIPVELEDRYIQVSGYIAKPDFYRSSRIYEQFFVNKRAVYNRSLYKGVEAGYRGLLPPRAYPAVFLNIKLNQILVDVNVHPTKREIKFSRNEIIQDVLKKGIKTILNSYDNTPKYRKKDNIEKTRTDQQSLQFKQNNEIYGEKLSTAIKKNNSEKKNLSETIINKTENSRESITKTNTINQNDKTLIKEKNIDNKQPGNETQVREKSRTEKFAKPAYNILSQLHNTYILVEVEDGLYIVDQHNAQERFLYENFQRKYNQQKIISQPLLIPVNIEVTASEMEIINKYMDNLQKLGFKLESFGTKSFIIREVPDIIKQRSHKKVLREIIDKLIVEGKTMKQAELIEEIIKYMSCRSAVKAGTNLTQVEMNKIVNDLFQTENPYRCPHGRPIIIHLTEAEIEKDMGRR